MSTILVALVTAAVTAGGPALAHGVQHAIFAHDSDKVDGKHAVGASASPSARAGKLVATNSNGRLPNGIITKAPDADKLDGVSSAGFLRATAKAADANKLDGLDSTAFEESFNRIVVVSPGGGATANGTRLRDALAAIPSSGGSAPSSSAPWLILIEPGTYNLGTTELEMRPWVDLRGSGMHMTTVTCACSTPSNAFNKATVQAADNSNLQAMTIENAGGPDFYAPAVRADGTSTELTAVRLVAAGVGNSFGVIQRGAGHVRITNAVVNATSTGGNGIALYTQSAGGVRVSDSRVTGQAYSLLGEGGSVRAAGTELTGTASNAVCVGAYTGAFVALNAACQP